MSDQGVREIQLSGKQLVFMFMAAVVFTVVVFLLGVSVGRGARDRTSGTVMADASGAAKSTELPPATKAAPGDLTYDTALQSPKSGDAGKTTTVDLPKVDSPEVAKRNEIAAAQKALPPPPPLPPPPAETKAAPPPETKAAPPPVTTPPAATKPAPAASQPSGSAWYVQVGLFKERANAEKVVRDLKAEGHAAFMQEASGSHRVRVGPFAEKPQADSTAKRLAKYKAMVTR